MKQFQFGVRRYMGAVLGLSLVCASAFPASAAEPAAPNNAVLSWTGDPAATITAVWRDDSALAEVMQVVAETEYGANGFTNAVTAEAECKDISLDGSGVWHYEATVTGLAPDTVYCYRVGSKSTDGWSEVKTFKTDDPESESVTFAYMGDVQTAGDMESDYALWCELCAALYQRNPELSFGVLGGDLVNSGISTEMFDCLLKNH